MQSIPRNVHANWNVKVYCSLVQRVNLIYHDSSHVTQCVSVYIELFGAFGISVLIVFELVTYIYDFVK